MKKISIVLLVLIALPLVAPAPVRAIPAFARKYGFNCMMCHTAYPKLNDWGQRYRDNGYQLPGQEGREKTLFDSPTPIALRTSTGLNGWNWRNHGGSTIGFDLMGLDLLAAGVMHKNVSVLLIYTPRLDEPTSDWRGTDPLQPGALESASVIFNNIIPGALNLRIGRFEPAVHPFSSKRSYYLLEPYEVYGFVTPLHSFVFDDNQIGVEATGHFRCGFKYGAGIVNGTGPTPDNNRFKDLYANVSQTIGAGDGQSAGQRIGAFVYYGMQPLMAGGPTSPTGEIAGMDDRYFYRVGGSASLNWRTLNLQAVYLYGFNEKEADEPHYADYTFNGGFAELDYAGLYNNRLVASALYNWVRPPEWDEERGINAYSSLVRYYFGDWSAVNVALHGEYTFRVVGKGDRADKESLYSLLMDFGF